MSFWEIIFWIAAFIIFYTYIGYAVFLWLITRFSSKSLLSDDFAPPVTLVVPVYNEEQVIEEKIQNSLALDYPDNRLTFLFINDGSTDRTAEIIAKYPQINLITNQQRSGKTAALNIAMQSVNTPVVVFTDANSFLHAGSLKKMVRHYINNKVGGVSGEKKIQKQQKDSIVSNAEQLYWKYESFLKKADSDFYSVVGADGGLFSIRTHLFQPVNESVILDDFFISVQVCEKGYRFVYEPEAYGVEASSASLKEEQKRKIRISAGCFQALFLLRRLLNPFRHFRLFLLYFSHRVLRWAVCPILLPLLFALNGMLAFSGYGPYVYLFLFQCAFYVMALVGIGLAKSGIKARLMLIPYYFVFMNFSLYLGFLRFIYRKQTVFWEKSQRIIP